MKQSNIHEAVDQEACCHEHLQLNDAVQSFASNETKLAQHQGNEVQALERSDTTALDIQAGTAEQRSSINEIKEKCAKCNMSIDWILSSLCS